MTGEALRRCLFAHQSKNLPLEEVKPKAYGVRGPWQAELFMLSHGKRGASGLFFYFLFLSLLLVSEVKPLE